jgi:type IV secretory pathway component VirB8
MENTDQKLAELEAKIDAIYISVEKTRKYFLTTLIISVVMFVLPLIGLALAIPVFLKTLSAYAL